MNIDLKQFGHLYQCKCNCVSHHRFLFLINELVFAFLAMYQSYHLARN